MMNFAEASSWKGPYKTISSRQFCYINEDSSLENEEISVAE